jgi:aspartyl-tRNA(Asn)/glutamyl-tRNA(Gln) amidotransferase subunit B
METRSMRSKEEANDYRYFPDPDLLPVIISDAQIETARAALPELPAARRERFVADFGVTEYDAHVLTLTREMSDFYEVVVAAAGGAAQGKVSANWVMGEFSGALNKAGLELADSLFRLKNWAAWLHVSWITPLAARLRSKYSALCGMKAKLRTKLLRKKA